MNMKQWLIIPCLVTGVLWAADYRLETLIESGLKNSISMQQKAIQNDNSKSDLKAATLDFLPEANVSLSRADQDGTIAKSGSLTLSKLLTINEPTYYGYRQAKYDRESSLLSFEQARKQYVYDVLSQYLDVVSAKKELAIQQTNLELQDRVYSETELLYQQGRKSQYDLNQADIVRINSQIQLESARKNYLNQRLQLFSLVRVQDDGTDLPEPDLTILEALAGQTDTATLQHVLSQKMMEIELRKSRLSVTQQQMNFLPTISASYSRNWNSMRNEPFEFQNYQNSYTFMLSGTYSLWNLWKHGTDYHKVKNSYRLAELNKEDSAIQLGINQENMNRDFEYMHKSYQLQLRKKQQAADNLLIAQEKYRLGLMSLLDLEQARLDDLNAKLETNTNYYNLLKKQEEYHLLMSSPLLGKW